MLAGVVKVVLKFPVGVARHQIVRGNRLLHERDGAGRRVVRVNQNFVDQIEAAIGIEGRRFCRGTWLQVKTAG